MKCTNFLQQIDLVHLVSGLEKLKLPDLVDEVFRGESELNPDKDQNLYHYTVPKLTQDGSCSVGNLLEDKLYDLSQIFKITPQNSLWLFNLNQVVSKLQQNTDVDWLGIYKKVRKENGEDVLLKLAYYGAPSRAEFPLTKEFAARSNNSTVGHTKKAILVQDVTEYKGTYYKCDSRVKSEFCCPILNSEGNVLGIIDAESFTQNFFDNKRLLQIVKICCDLEEYL